MTTEVKNQITKAIDFINNFDIRNIEKGINFNDLYVYNNNPYIDEERVYNSFKNKNLSGLVYMKKADGREYYRIGGKYGKDDMDIVFYNERDRTNNIAIIEYMNMVLNRFTELDKKRIDKIANYINVEVKEGSECTPIDYERFATFINGNELSNFKNNHIENGDVIYIFKTQGKRLKSIRIATMENGIETNTEINYKL